MQYSIALSPNFQPFKHVSGSNFVIVKAIKEISLRGAIHQEGKVSKLPQRVDYLGCRYTRDLAM